MANNGLSLPAVIEGVVLRPQRPAWCLGSVLHGHIRLDALHHNHRFYSEGDDWDELRELIWKSFFA